jgi:flavin reductase (DIM6/NTAB) family NADH-FMN oxidoreductase RutF
MPDDQTPDSETLDPAAKKTVLRWFTYGLYVVTTRDGEETGAFTANWLSQASFDPPLVMVSVEKDSHSLPIIRASKTFTVNVLETGQRRLAGHFGKKTAKVGDKLADIEHYQNDSGLPILNESLGYVVCTVINEMDAGDSVVVLGEVVEAATHREEAEPLTMAEAGFRHSG